MNLWSFFVAEIALFSLLQFLWIPAVERRLGVNRSPATIGNFMLLAVLGVLRSVLLITTLTTVVIAVIMQILLWQGGATPSEVLAAIETVRRWRSSLVGFGPMWGAFVVITLVLGMILYARRRAKVQAMRAFQRVAQEAVARLEPQYDRGELPALPPTREMLEVLHKITQVEQALQHLAATQVTTDEDSNNNRQKLMTGYVYLKAILRSLDLHRRIDLQLAPEDTNLPRAVTFWDKVQTFLFSRGLLINLNRGTRLIYTASMVLLIPCLLGLYSGPIGQQLERRLVELNDLRIQFEIEQSDAELKEVKEGLGEPQSELSQQDQQLVRETAQAFEHAFVNSYLSTIDSAARFNLRSTVVRSEILNRAVAHSRTVLEELPSGSAVGQLSPLERDLVAVAEQSLNDGIAPTKISEHVSRELDDLARRSPSFLEHLRVERRNFLIPASHRDISHSLFTHVTGAIFDGANQSEIGRFVEETILNLNLKPERMSQLLTNQANHFLIKLAQGEGMAASLEGVQFAHGTDDLQPIMRTIFGNLPVAQANSTLRDFPPAVEALVEPHVNLPGAIQHIEELQALDNFSGGRRDVQLADAVSDFRNWFPAQVDADAGTDYARLLTEWTDGDAGSPFGSGGGASGGGGGSGGGGSGGLGLPSGGGGNPGSGNPGPRVSGSPDIRIPKTNSFVRARSFGRLLGFSRIGGVLIGRDANSATPWSIADLAWEENGVQIRLVLIDDTGKEYRSAWFNKTIAYHALNYAADGRPIAVTMITAPPMQELKILLHPTLIDSPMGVRITELDRFVDQYTSDTQERVEAHRLIDNQNQLYKFAWAVRMKMVISQLSKSEPGAATMLADYRAVAESLINDPELRTAVTAALVNIDDLRDPTRSPLGVKREFYDNSLVELLIQVGQQATTAETLATGLTDALLLPVTTQMELMFEQWLAPPPQYEIWSGVREKGFDLTPAQLLLPESAEAPLPIQFTLQVAFTSPPAFLPAGQNPEEYNDDTPWEFPYLKQFIEETTLAAIADDERSRIILKDAAEFTYLQRLFRMALDGQLGENFPVEKLVSLTGALDGSQSTVPTRTLRWNARPGLIEILQAEIAKNNEDRAYLEQILQIRQELGIAVDEEQIIRERDEPLPSLN